MKDNKKEKLEKEINSKINKTLSNLENINNLDYFDIEIKVHQNNVNLKYTIKDKGRVY